MTPKNLLIIISDEHNPKTLGCYGHPIVKTPHLDRLAGCGIRFTKAYCNSPVCIPARAVIATGRYINQIGFWDNADPYDGLVTSWHHRLREAGHQVVSIGKLHFRSTEDDNGFSEEIVPMHVIEGKGDLMGLVREDLPRRGSSWKMAGMAGPGESPYTFYDRDITARAQVWLREEANRHKEKPWVLFVSLVCPHFPLTAPPEHFYRYYFDENLPWPKLYDRMERPEHPYLKEYGSSFAYDEHFESPDQVRRGVAGYLGLCSFLDENVGKILDALEQAGLSDDTRVIYTSDHGDNLGARGVWGKSTMYEEAVAVPWIMAGADIPTGKTFDAPVSHVDLYPTILEATGLPLRHDEDDLPGCSLLNLSNGPLADRFAFSEYHGMGSTGGIFMIRDARYKYIYYVNHPTELFDLESDPEELHNLAQEPAYEAIRSACDSKLRSVCDPEHVERRAKERQSEQLQRHGGREAVIARGDLGFSPPPGISAEFS
jgi:choline-sulfatase